MILSFQLTMPNVGSWNGKWTGESNGYFKCINVSKSKAVEIVPDECKSNSFHYSWNDGWGANVEVKRITSSEKRKLEKNTSGFYGYEWMIDSILKNNKIIVD